MKDYAMLEAMKADARACNKRLQRVMSAQPDRDTPKAPGQQSAAGQDRLRPPIGRG